MYNHAAFVLGAACGIAGWAFGASGPIFVICLWITCYVMSICVPIGHAVSSPEYKNAMMICIQIAVITAMAGTGSFLICNHLYY